MKVKIVVSIILVIITGMLNNTIEPLMKNQVYLTQFEDNYTSFTNYTTYQEIGKYSWTVVAIIILLIFSKEIKNKIKRIKGGNTSEKSN